MWVCVIRDITKILVRKKQLVINDLKPMRVYFSYERLPNYCYGCGVIGHGLECNLWVDKWKKVLEDQLPYNTDLRAGFQGNKKEGSYKSKVSPTQNSFRQSRQGNSLPQQPPQHLNPLATTKMVEGTTQLPHGEAIPNTRLKRMSVMCAKDTQRSDRSKLVDIRVVSETVWKKTKKVVADQEPLCLLKMSPSKVTAIGVEMEGILIDIPILGPYSKIQLTCTLVLNPRSGKNYRPMSPLNDAF